MSARGQAVVSLPPPGWNAVPGSSYSRFREDESNEDIPDSNSVLALGFLASGARGGDDWDAPPPAMPNPSGGLGQPLAAGVSLGLPVAVLGDPVPLDANPAGGRTVVIDPHLERTGYSPGGDPDSPWVVRGQNPDATPKPMPLGPNTPDSGYRVYTLQPALQPDPAPIAPPPEQLPTPRPTLGNQPDSRPGSTVPVIPMPVAPSPGAIPVPVPLPGPSISAGQMPGVIVSETPGFPAMVPPGGMPSSVPGDCCTACPTVDGCGCGCACGCCSCYPGNRFYVSAEYLGWFLAPNKLPPLLTTSSAADPNDPLHTGALGMPLTQVVYGNNNVAGDYRSGVRMMAGYWFDDDHCLGLELGGFWVQPDMNSVSIGSQGNPPLYRPIFNTSEGRQASEIVASAGIPGQASTAGGFTAVNTSMFWGAEANLRSCLLCCDNFFIDGLAGVKTLGLYESLTMQENPTVTANFTIPGTGIPGLFVPAGTASGVQDRFATGNQFYGGQLGLAGEVRNGAWSLDMTAKLGVGVTAQTVNISGFTIVQAPGIASQGFPTGLYAGPNNSGLYHRNVFSVVPDIGLGIGYQITQHIRAFAGYDFLYWSSVVRPGAQIDQVVNPNNIAGSPNPGVGPNRPGFAFNATDFWAQGIKIGLEFRY